ncbi:Hypothetical predicted protein [Paramuricea clavata]|uniref:Uncharacterized protein n=1 Tax=Paramuricea clavata TaxID=317549 RepID=A0A7D9K1C0_PARCT|nr:Hypothetical predicted protein [Paramuricea clavata]
MTVGHGVLQGDCLSPLLFNMCFNTFIQHIKAEKYRQFGFSFKLLNPIHWFQFADDATVITGQESENQHLLNRFSIWCQWSDMIIRVDKCSTFGIKKAITKSVQYLPKLIISNQLIPKITIGESFQYLGRYFDFHMSNDNHKTELTTLLNELMSDIDSKPLHPKNKLLLYSRPETLLHIVAGCQFYLDRFTWRHNSVLNFLAHQLQTVDGSTLYADLNGFKSPSILTGDTYRPDLLLSCSNGSLYVVELTTCYETNLKNNVKRKKDKYRELLRQLAWSCGVVPSEWKKACTILIHKKGETANPADFRPITLESVPLKVFTSCLRNRTFQFLAEKNYREQNIQKGFTPKLSGTLEQLAHIINKARVKQRSLIVTLLDLKNAFGEVHHNLIYEVLEYHHIPNHIENLVCSLYTDFQTSIITEQFNTSFITVGRGVLQGDCLSPLLFNMPFNTFIQHIESEKYRQLGFWKSSENGTPLNPPHWFQFADDAAVVSGQEKENQMLLNRFTIWCQWAQMIIRVDKCSTFGIRKQVTKSIQYLPKLFINNCLVPRVELGKSFRYLGRYFGFNMSDEDHKSEVYDTLTSILNEIDDLATITSEKQNSLIPQSLCAFQNLLALHCF